MFQDYIIFTIATAGVVAALLMLVRAVFYSQIKRVADEKNAELMVWMLFREKWAGKQNEVLYAWRQVLYDLKNNHAPRAQIEAAERAVKEYERRLTKARWMVNANRLSERITIGGS